VIDHFAGRIAEDYDKDLPGSFSPDVLDPAVDFLAMLAEGGRCLEFAIGTGRVALPLTAKGLTVDGIEYSPDMVKQLRKKPGGQDLTIAMGDMATVDMATQYSLVFLVFNTIMNLTSQKQQVQCFRNASRHLLPGGKFVVEVMVPALRSYPPGAIAVPCDISKTHLGFDTYATAEQKLTSHHVTIADNGQAIYHAHPFRYVWPSELDLMAELAGMSLVSRHADWRGSAFTDDSRQHVSVWQKS
jgi:SAM-dependent methyltransferase